MLALLQKYRVFDVFFFKKNIKKYVSKKKIISFT